MPNQQEVEQDIHDVLTRLRSGGRKGNASRSFTRTGDEQRLKDLRQERQDLVRGWGGRFRVGEPVIGTQYNGRTEPLVYDGMASDTHAYVKDSRAGLRRPGTVPVRSLSKGRSVEPELDAISTPTVTLGKHIGQAHKLRNGAAVGRIAPSNVGEIDVTPASTRNSGKDAPKSAHQRRRGTRKPTTLRTDTEAEIGSPANSSSDAGGYPPNSDPPTSQGGSEPPNNPEWETRVLRERHWWLEATAASYGISSKAMANRINQRFRKLLDDMQPFIRVREKDFLEVLQTGRFKTQFETGTSTGYYDPSRRARLEKAFFGLPEDADPTQRPIYGYMHSEESGFREGEIDTLEQYGEIAVRLGKTIRNRTTATVGDSLDETDGGILSVLAPASLSEPKWIGVARTTGDLTRFATASDMLAELESTPWTTVNYVEAQFHGGVERGDIEEVIFLGEPPSVALREALQESGIPWRLR